MSSSLQQIKQGTKRKSNGYFFIKSKHAHPTYKNHSYFEMRQKNKTEHSQHVNIIIGNKQQQYYDNENENYRNRDSFPLKKWQMFVDQPSSFGIQNTYKYMCSRIKLAKNKTKEHKQTHKEKQKDIQKQQTPDKNHKNQQEIQKIGRSRYRSHTQNSEGRNLNHHKYIILKEPDKIEPLHKYLKTTQSFNYRIRKSKNLKQQPQPLPLQSSINHQYAAQHKLQLLYISSRANPSSELNSIITLNLLPYIIHCFLKCKINYNKKLTQSQYQGIKTSILEIQHCPKSHFDIKDILNLSSVQQIIEILKIYGKDTLQWIQTIRYFFIPNQQVLKYQYNKIIDQIKTISILKFNVQFRNEDSIYIYRVQDKVRISNVYDLLKPGTYIFSQSKAVYEIYCSIIKYKAQVYSYKNRIRKWRSIAPLDQTVPSFITDRKNSIISHQQHQNSQQKYQRLFQIRKQHRKKSNIPYNKNMLSNSKKSILMTSGISGNETAGGSGYISFIDKSKLHHYEDIFQ